jgi:RHS repeat-associated protein
MAETVLAMGGSGERTVRSYPLYDGHGNTVGQVARAEDGAPDASFAPVPGAANFALGARRKCGAWGQVRWSEGSPLDQGYCGSLQHRRDAESGLVYMRARYYEPWTGRFVSEDPAMDGANWYAYCSNDPVNRIDRTGCFSEGYFQALGFLGLIVGAFSVSAMARPMIIGGMLLIFGQILAECTSYDYGWQGSQFEDREKTTFGLTVYLVMAGAIGYVLGSALGLTPSTASGSVVFEAIGVIGAYTALIGLMMWWWEL